MDAMALLCTLHADGPASLRRLREAGCASFEALAALEADRLADVLAISPSAARRLLRMAAGLRERVDEEVLESEEVLHPATAASAPAEIAAGTSPEDRSRGGDDGGPADGGPPALEPAPAMGAPGTAPPSAAEADRELVERVIERWRENDARTASPSELVAPAFAAAFEPASDLCPGVIDGLDEAQRGVLLEAGYSTLCAVAEGDATEIARTCGLGYSQVKRIQFLARRVLDARGQAVESTAELIPTPPPTIAEPDGGERISLAFPPAGGPSVKPVTAGPPVPARREGAGGPFA